MFADTIPWKLLSATIGVGVLTEDWNLADVVEDDGEPDPSEVRSFAIEVVFAEPFNTPPVVHLGLTGLDLEERGSSRLTLTAGEITPHGFRATVSTWRGSRVYAVEFSWLAIGA